MACLSAMQKSIRRGLEVEAMEFACELIHTSQGFFTMVCNRLEVISHEDIDTCADPTIVPFVKTAMEQAQEWYKKAIKKDPNNPGAARMPVGNAIRMMCRAIKSREGDHYQAAIGLKSVLEGYVPTIPDWANDGHTLAGKRLGRGLDHFRKESAKLNGPVRRDAYESEAYRLWKIKESTKRSRAPARAGKESEQDSLFD
jgi:replication-associated recombination protein RarA